MSKLASRLLVFFIGVPLIVSFTFIDVCNFLPLQLLVYIFSGLTAIEFSNILAKRYETQNKNFIIILSYVILFMNSLNNYFNFDYEIIILTIFLTLFSVFLFEIFSKKSSDNNFSISIERISTSLLILLYSGYFFSYIIKMTSSNWFSNYLIENSKINSLCMELF